MYMAVSNCNEIIHSLERPRRDLLKRLGRKSARKIYRDKNDGTTVHVGYIIGGMWWTIYEVTPMERPADF